MPGTGAHSILGGTAKIAFLSKLVYTRIEVVTKMAENFPLYENVARGGIPLFLEAV